jgi:hypothetical protein
MDILSHRLIAIISIPLLLVLVLITFGALQQVNRITLIEDARRFVNIAVIVDDRVSEALLRAVINVVKNVPDDWPIQIITLAEHRHFLETSSVKDYMRHGKVFMTDLKFANRISSISPIAYSNKILASIEFWQQVRGEKVLIFQTDSTFCSNSSYKITDFLKYDFIGAPWHSGGCCNGGFSLRSREKILQILKRAHYTGESNEDIWYSHQLTKVNASIAPSEVARVFSVETIYHPYPLAVHKPRVEHLGIRNMRRLCNECPETQLVIPYCFH